MMKMAEGQAGLYMQQRRRGRLHRSSTHGM